MNSFHFIRGWKYYASPGVGVKIKDRPHGAPRSFGPYGLRHVNGAGQEFREFLQAQQLAKINEIQIGRAHV